MWRDPNAQRTARISINENPRLEAVSGDEPDRVSDRDTVPHTKLNLGYRYDKRTLPRVRAHARK